MYISNTSPATYYKFTFYQMRAQPKGRLPVPIFAHLRHLVLLREYTIIKEPRRVVRGSFTAGSWA